MASVTMISDLHELLQCGICYQPKKEPKMLRCQHSFCTVCLQKWIDSSLSDDYVSCPICRTKTCPPDQNVRKLRSDHMQRKLSDILKQPHIAVCEVCPGLEVGAPAKPIIAKHLCKNCHIYMCEECSTNHKTFKSFINHKLVLTTESTNGEEFCLQHPLKCKDYYCEVCDILICVVCAMSDHIEHQESVYDAAQYVKQHRKSFDKSMADLEKIYDLPYFYKYNDSLRSLERVDEGMMALKKKVKDHGEFIIQGIKAEIEDLHDAIDESRSVLDEWHAWAEGTKKLKPYVEKMVRKYKAYSQSKRPADLLHGFRDLRSKLDRGILKFGGDMPSHELLEVPVDFVEAYPNISIGKVVKRGEEDTVITDSEYRIQILHTMDPTVHDSSYEDTSPVKSCKRTPIPKYNKTKKRNKKKKHSW